MKKKGMKVSICYSQLVDEDVIIVEPDDSDGTIPFFKDDLIVIHSENDTSGCLISNKIKIPELNKSSPFSIEYISIFGSTDVKYNSIPCFFRTLTKSHCNLNMEEEKILCEKILLHYKKAEIKVKEQNKDLYLSLENEEKANDPSTPNSNNIFQGMGVIDNINFNSGIHEDSLINDLNLENILITKNENEGTALKMFEKNKQVYTNLNSTKFNILVVGEKGSGKTTFINSLFEKLNVSVGMREELMNDSDFICNETKHTVTFTSRKMTYLKKNNIQNMDEKIFELKIIDSPGFNKENLNSSKQWLKEILKYINQKVR